MGFPGRTHHARVLQHSKLWRISETEENRLFYGNGHLIGDSAYPLRNWLMVPFTRHNGLNPDEANFNRRPSGGRVCVKNAFGWLKSRRRHLVFIAVNSIEKITIIITACCVLHNFCLLSDYFMPEEDIINVPPLPELLFTGPQQINTLNKRNTLKHALV